MAKQVNMHEAKSNLSKLGELVEKGETVVIAKAGKPYMDLVPHKERGARTPGCLTGRIKIAADFDQTSEAVIAAFEGDSA